LLKYYYSNTIVTYAEKSSEEKNVNHNNTQIIPKKEIIEIVNLKSDILKMMQ
jgi:hypothetical protein